MGCGSSKAKEAYDAITKNANYPQWSLQFQALQLTHSEVKKLHSYFFKADMDNGGTIELVELLTVIDVERTKFTERVFSIFDEDGSGKIDFGEFVLALWNYCTLSKVILSKSLSMSAYLLD